MLAPFAFRVEQSSGRRYAEAPHPYRDDFQRDRDRIIHSRAFRRLENKTQVFTTRYSDHFRNRLTHTIEVAQIARTVGAALGLNVELCEALALVHDVGHPPFGHSGEKSLNQVMRRIGERFEHNLHALRIVEHFEQRYAAFPGLNLTFEVREGIVKHSRDYALEQHPALAEYRLEKKPPLEAQLIDPADEIAYNTADLDDGFEADLLELEQIRAEVPLFNAQYDAVEAAFPAASGKLKFNEALKRVLNCLASDLIEHTRAALEREGIGSVEDVRDFPRRLVRFSTEMSGHNRGLKEFLYRCLYDHPALCRERERGAEMVAELFSLYLESPDRLPRAYRARIAHQPQHRVICDYIAGMTDTFLQKQFHEVAAQTPALGAGFSRGAQRHRLASLRTC